MSFELGVPLEVEKVFLDVSKNSTGGYQFFNYRLLSENNDDTYRFLITALNAFNFKPTQQPHYPPHDFLSSLIKHFFFWNIKRSGRCEMKKRKEVKIWCEEI